MRGAALISKGRSGGPPVLGLCGPLGGGSHPLFGIPGYPREPPPGTPHTPWEPPARPAIPPALPAGPCDHRIPRSRKTCAGTGHKESLCGAGGTKAALCGEDPPPLLRQAPGAAGTGDTLAECPGHGQGSHTVFGLRSSRRAPPSPPLIASQPPAVPHPLAQLNGTPAMRTKTCGGPAVCGHSRPVGRAPAVLPADPIPAPLHSLQARKPVLLLNQKPSRAPAEAISILKTRLLHCPLDSPHRRTPRLYWARVHGSTSRPGAALSGCLARPPWCTQQVLGRWASPAAPGHTADAR